MDTIKKGRFENMNKMFQKPKKYNLRIQSKNAKKWSRVIKDGILSETKEREVNTAIILCGRARYKTRNSW